MGTVPAVRGADPVDVPCDRAPARRPADRRAGICLRQDRQAVPAADRPCPPAAAEGGNPRGRSRLTHASVQLLPLAPAWLVHGAAVPDPDLRGAGDAGRGAPDAGPAGRIGRHPCLCPPWTYATVALYAPARH